MPVPELVVLFVTGLLAGALGGLLGIGGSVVMIPVLTLILHRDQHLSQAAAMVVNVAVAVPAVVRHHRAGAVRWDVFARVVPFGLLFILIGVELSNHMDGRVLMRCFGVFLIYAIYANVRKLFVRRISGEVGSESNAASSGTDVVTQPSDQSLEARGSQTWWRCGVVGSITGLFAGLLGIGGGVIAVPLFQRVCRMRLRPCIATSSAVICVTAVIGAARKNLTLADAPTAEVATVSESLFIAACLAPTAIVGSMIGANLTHVLPLRLVRLVLIGLLVIACVRFLMPGAGS